MPARKEARNQEIRTRAAAGESFSDLGRRFGISRQRVEQIARPRRDLARRRAKETEIPDGQACERCEERPAAERHHPDYDTPDLVELLCPPCHRIADRERHEHDARRALGLPEWEDVETISEAARRVGTGTPKVSEGVAAGVIRSHGSEWAVFVIPSEVDAWVTFVRRRSDIRRRAESPSQCPNGHLFTPWNTATNEGKRYCKACNSDRVQEIGGGRATTLPTQYDICLALHQMECDAIDGHHNRIVARHPSLGSIKVSRGGTSLWVVRVEGEDIGRAATIRDVWGLLGEDDVQVA